MGRIIYDMPSSVYHANCGEDVPLFSNSIAKVLVGQSPLHAYHAHPRLGGGGTERTKSLDDGTIADAILTGDMDSIAITHEYKNFAKKEAQAWRDDMLAKGKAPITAEKFAEHKKAADTVKARLAAAGVDLSGVYQSTILFDLHATDGTPVKCKARLDLLLRDRLLIVDFKRTQSKTIAKERKLQMHCEEYGYDIQSVMYRLAVESLDPDYAGRASFAFAFFEGSAPNAVRLVHPSGSFTALGTHKLQVALDKWAACLRTGVWPGYDDLRLSATPWSLADAMIDEVDE